MPVEEQARRYAFLVDTAEGAALRAAHEWALGALSAGELAALVVAVQDHTLAGVRLTPRDVPALARLLVAAERRRPSQVLESLPTALRVRVHATVVGALAWDEAAYAGWSPRVKPLEDEVPPSDRGWDSIDDHQVYRFTHHSQEVIGGSQAVFRRRGG
jgi:hypothetical protein